VLALALVATFSLLVLRREQWTVYKPKPDWRAAAAWLEREAGRRGGAALVTTTPSLEVDFYLGRSGFGHPRISAVDFCQSKPSLLSLSRSSGAPVFLVKNETWLGCFTEAWAQAVATPALALRGEQHFTGLALYEFGTSETISGLPHQK
jgi:hypothetical protein